MTWTCKGAAQEWGLDQVTMRRRLIAAGHEVGPGKKFTTREISDALNGRLEQEKIRLTKADADAKEAENLERAGVTIRKDDAMRLVSEVIAPVRSALLSWPASLATRLNPTDPELARTVLDAEVRRLLGGEK
jgi:phage terminase Nu1 subunit (DNA packaging protein)